MRLRNLHNLQLHDTTQYENSEWEKYSPPIALYFPLKFLYLSKSCFERRKPVVFFWRLIGLDTTQAPEVLEG
jgi:hypothetical protein